MPTAVAHTAASRAVLDDLGVRIRATPRPAEQRRHRRSPFGRRSALMFAAIGVLVAGTAAAATTVLTTYTGTYNKGWEVNAGGPGELLLQGAPNFCRAALKLSSDIPYPSGYRDWRPWVLVTELGQPRVTTTGACGSNSSGGEGKAVLVSTGAVRGYIAMSAFCAWTDDWRQAKSRGNTAAERHATKVIASALTWPAVTAEDPHPTAAPVSQTRFGLTGDHSLFGWFIPFQRAVQSGSLTRVNALIASHYGTAGCSFFRPPSDSHGGTVNPLLAHGQGKSS